MAEITQFRPMLPMPRLRRELDRLMGDLLPQSWGIESEEFPRMWNPRMDVTENDTEFIVQVDLPGVSKDDVAVNIQDNQLTISGERKTESKETKQNYLRMERSYGRFFRSLGLPRGANADTVDAEFKDGVLTVHIPKAEESKPKQVRVA